MTTELDTEKSSTTSCLLDSLPHKKVTEDTFGFPPLTVQVKVDFSLVISGGDVGGSVGMDL